MTWICGVCNEKLIPEINVQVGWIRFPIKRRSPVNCKMDQECAANQKYVWTSLPRWPSWSWDEITKISLSAFLITHSFSHCGRRTLGLQFGSERRRSSASLQAAAPVEASSYTSRVRNDVPFGSTNEIRAPIAVVFPSPTSLLKEN